MALTENDRKQEKKEKPLTKVIIRRLPPSMDQQTFLNQCSPVPDYNYIYMVKGDYSLGENAFSRVYINFVCPNDVYSFKERFDNYVFLDNKGNEYPAVVEFAPFQKIPKKRGKVRMDPKCATIESDPFYLDFLESLNKPQEEQEEKPEYTLQLNNEDKNDITTPLLEYIKNKQAQRIKMREVRREERKRREFDRKKDYGKVYEDRKYEDRSSTKSFVSKPHSAKVASVKQEKSEAKNEKKSVGKPEGKPDTVEEKPEKVYEKSSGFYKNKERKYEEKRKEIKPRFPKKEYGDTREYKRTDDYKDKDYRSKYDDYKKDETKTFPKKVKKYSEKREERKMEAQKAEQKKLEEQSKGFKEAEPSKNAEASSSKNSEASSSKIEKEEKKPKSPEPVKTVDKPVKQENDTKMAAKSEDKDISQEKEGKSKDGDSHSSRRIRNKDRPTIAIYRPGMLSKRKQNDGDTDNKN